MPPSARGPRREDPRREPSRGAPPATPRRESAAPEDASTAPSAPSSPDSGLTARPLAALAALRGELPSQAPTSAAAPPSGSAPASPFAGCLRGRLVIAREAKGRGGKTVTIVRGVEGRAAQLEELARELRHELGTNVRLEDGALVAQGALTERIAAALRRRGAARIVIGN